MLVLGIFPKRWTGAEGVTFKTMHQTSLAGGTPEPGFVGFDRLGNLVRAVCGEGEGGR